MAVRRASSYEDVYEPDPDGVFRRLQELGIPSEAPTEAVRIGYQAGDFTTAAHPITYQGVVIWAEITAEFRNRMALEGWVMNDDDCIPRAIRPDGQVVVVPVRGNAMTGIRNAHARLSTHRARGNAGVRIVRVNTQYSLQLEEGSRHADLLPGMGGTWFLLYNREEDVLRLELSFARAVSRSGELLQWSERLILPDINLSGPEGLGLGGNDTEPPIVDVPVPMAPRTSKAG